MNCPRHLIPEGGGHISSQSEPQAVRRRELQKVPGLISNSFRGPGFLVLTRAGVRGEYPDHLALSLFVSGDEWDLALQQQRRRQSLLL